MTSGPAPTGALPPEPQPDPQVIAWMREYMQGHPFPTKVRTVAAWLDAHGYDSFTASGRTLPELTAAANAACSPKPLTVADIPAGQGAASLYIGPGRYGELAVMYRTGLDHDHVFMTEGRDDPSETRRAMWEHLAATLPTVTAEETP